MKHRFGLFLLVIFSLAFTFSLLELGSMGYLYVINKQMIPKKELQSTLDLANTPIKKDDLVLEDTSPPWLREHVLHPYFGFVRNPDKEQQIFNNLLVDKPVNKFGFFGASPVIDGDQSKFVVGIFGGSVAAELYLYAGNALKKQIEKLPIAQGKEVELISIALGGMKQPQQLLALNYLLVTGHRFDMVVNIDGFNEIVLPFSDNIPFGVAVSFPRNWRAYATKSISPKAMKIAGEAQMCKEDLATWRALFSQKWARESYFLLTLWQAIYQTTLKECAVLEVKLRKAFLRSKVDIGFQERGPIGDAIDESNVLDQSSQVWKRASILMWETCKSNKIKYIHILQPNQYVENSKVLTAYEKKTAIVTPNHPYRVAVENGYPLLRETGSKMKQLGVPYFDLTMLFRDEQGSIYKDTCCHLNQDGNLLLARKIAELIRTTQNTD